MRVRVGTVFVGPVMDAGGVIEEHAGRIDDRSGRVAVHGCCRRRFIMGVRVGSVLMIIAAACRSSEGEEHGHREGKETVSHLSHVRFVDV
jgi:hypothetical protein